MFHSFMHIFSLVPRDINERGRDLDAVLTQYMTFVKPAFEEFCSPVCIYYSIQFNFFNIQLIKLHFLIVVTH